MRRLVTCLATLLTIALWQPRAVEAAPILTLKPSAITGAPGETIGWGYEIANDSDDTLFFSSISATLPLSDGTINLAVFDFFNFAFFIAPHTTVTSDYDPVLGLGLAEVTLSSLLTPGTVVTGQVFLEYLLVSSLGLVSVGTFDVPLTATVTTPVPEPSTLLLLGTGAIALLRRRRLRLA